MLQRDSRLGPDGVDATVPPAHATCIPTCGRSTGDRVTPETRAAAPLSSTPPPPPPPPPAAVCPDSYHVPRNRNVRGPFYVVLEGKDVGIWQTW
jgi:hypothetical protein